MAGSSTSTVDEEASLALARQLQEEDDAAMAAQLTADEERSMVVAQQLPRDRPQAAARAPPHLASPAHKVCQHLGRQTCKKIAAHFVNQTTLTLEDLLRIFRSKRREELLMMVDAGQRERVEAEIVALDLDFAQ